MDQFVGLFDPDDENVETLPDCLPPEVRTYDLRKSADFVVVSVYGNSVFFCMQQVVLTCICQQSELWFKFPHKLLYNNCEILHVRDVRSKYDEYIASCTQNCRTPVRVLADF